jgi:hypothetical protein
MQCIAIRFRVDSNGAHAEFSAGAGNPYGDLATVGNEDFFQHWISNTLGF